MAGEIFLPGLGGAPDTMSADYEFHTDWRVPGTVPEIAEVLADAAALPRWWPSVYLSAVVWRRADADGSGAIVRLHTKGWLPYTLRWTLTVTEPVTVSGFALTADGDLVGDGRWSFEQDGPEVVVGYDWRVSASKPLLHRLTWLLRPAFAANHRWAMARGEESLKLELRRRRELASGANRPVPAPPGATFRRHRLSATP